MAETTYSYTISTATANGAVAGGELKKEIQAETNITISLKHTSTYGDTLDVVFNDALPGTQKVDYLDPLVLAHTGVASSTNEQRITEMGHGIIEIAPTQGSGTTVYSHDWCDPSTWYQESTEVTGVACTEVDGNTFKVPDTKNATDLRQDSYVYSIGDKYKVTKDKNKYWIYECTVAGTSAGTEPSHMPRKVDMTFSDGTATFKAIKPVILIDVCNAKLTDESALRATYQPTVYVDAVAQTMSSMHTRILYDEAISEGMSASDAEQYLDGDFCLDYEGTINFKSSVDHTGKAITIDYHKSNTSGFTVAPATGKILRVPRAEAQFADNVRLRDNNLFKVTVFGSPVKQITYESFRNYIDEATKSYPTIPAQDVNDGGYPANQRDLLTSSRPFHWEYITSADLKSSLSMAMKLELENDTPHFGDYATTSIYCEVVDE